jgi:hypothetical protein
MSYIKSQRTYFENICTHQSALRLGYWLDGRALQVRFQIGERVFFSCPQRPYRLWAHYASYTMGTRSVSPGVKWQGREDDDSPPSSDEVTNGGVIPPLPIRLHDVASH